MILHKMKFITILQQPSIKSITFIDTVTQNSKLQKNCLQVITLAFTHIQSRLITLIMNMYTPLNILTLMNNVYKEKNFM
jgi:hypothetical protein